MTTKKQKKTWTITFTDNAVEPVRFEAERVYEADQQPGAIRFVDNDDDIIAIFTGVRSVALDSHVMKVKA